MIKKKVKALAHEANRPMTTSLIELVILMGCVLAPMFVFASEVDGDEFVKAMSGVAFATAIGVIFGAYRLWKGK